MVRSLFLQDNPGGQGRYPPPPASSSRRTPLPPTPPCTTPQDSRCILVRELPRLPFFGACKTRGYSSPHPMMTGRSPPSGKIIGGGGGTPPPLLPVPSLRIIAVVNDCRLILPGACQTGGVPLPPNPAPLRPRIALTDTSIPELRAKTSHLCTRILENLQFFIGFTPIGAYSVAL